VFKLPERKILLNPGPLTTSDRVKLALVAADICPREKEFGDFVGGILHDLKRVIHGEESYEAILFGGSGTAAVEAVISSAASEKAAILILDNGAYGDRMHRIARVYYPASGIVHFKKSHTEPITHEDLDPILKANPSIRHVGLVHHETTTGMLNPAPAILKRIQKHGARIILDAMSSYGGIPIDLRHDAYDFVISSANKCLQGMPGASFVICRREALFETRDNTPKNLYLNLWQEYEHFKKNNQTRFTPPVQVIYALGEALKEFFEEGQTARHHRYIESWKTLTDGVKSLGFKLLLKEKYQSRLLTAIREPEDSHYSFDGMHDYLKERDITIYPGKTSEGSTFRIANIGAIDRRDMLRVIDVLRQYLDDRDIHL
jgi:2-aminoethylphosphonate aminotransferase